MHRMDLARGVDQRHGTLAQSYLGEYRLVIYQIEKIYNMSIMYVCTSE
jgi:hypothetical protein